MWPFSNFIYWYLKILFCCLYRFLLFISCLLIYMLNYLLFCLWFMNTHIFLWIYLETGLLWMHFYDIVARYSYRQQLTVRCLLCLILLVDYAVDNSSCWRVEINWLIIAWLMDCFVTVACQGKHSKSNSSVKYFVGFVELPCLSAPLGNVTQYKVRCVHLFCNLLSWCSMSSWFTELAAVSTKQASLLGVAQSTRNVGIGCEH